MAAKQQEVTKPKRDQLPAAYDYGEDVGAGFDEMDQSDYAVPFIAILQSTSPQLKKGDGRYIKGAEEGQLLNTSTNEVLAEIVFVPAHREHLFGEWVPRDAGGGFRGRHAVDSAVVAEAQARWSADDNPKKRFGKLKSQEGNDLVETFYLYGVMVDSDKNALPALIAFTSTQLRNYKGWMTRARNVRIKGSNQELPLFAHRYRLTTKSEQNELGSWMGWKVDFDGANANEARLAPDDPVYEAARSIRVMAKGGKLRVDESKLAVDDAEDIPYETSGGARKEY